MASADSEADREAAKALGFRTFRVRSKDEPKLKGEGICPASEEMNYSTNCGACLLCGGHSGKGKADIVIIAHGVGKINFERARV